MQNPKTTVAGYAGLVGTLLLLVGQIKPGSGWGATMTQLGILMNGGAVSMGVIAAKDGGH